jgi:hypothetical protein
VSLEALVIYDSVLFNRTGQVRRWANSLERRFTYNAQQMAPERSGELRAGIYGTVNRVGPRHIETLIYSTAPHTLYVVKGTTGPIMSNRLWGFRGRTGLDLPRGGRMSGSIYDARPNMPWLKAHGYALKLRAGGGFPQLHALSVSGQEANNFFADAATATARRHSSLRGFTPGYGF